MDKHKKYNCDIHGKKPKRILTKDELDIKSLVNQTISSKTDSLYEPPGILEKILELVVKKFFPNVDISELLDKFQPPDKTGQITAVLSKVMLLTNLFTREETVNQLNKSTTKIRRFMAKPQTKQKMANILANVEDLHRKTGINSTIYKTVSILYDIINDYSLLNKSKNTVNNIVSVGLGETDLDTSVGGASLYGLKRNFTFIINQNVGLLKSKKNNAALFAIELSKLIDIAFSLTGNPSEAPFTIVQAVSRPPYDEFLKIIIIEILTGTLLDCKLTFARDVANRIIATAKAADPGPDYGPPPPPPPPDSGPPPGSDPYNRSNKPRNMFNINYRGSTVK